MKNTTLNYNLEDLNIFTPELKGWRLHLFTVSSIAIAIIAIVTQITVYRSLKRLGPRPINQLIIPSQVSKLYEFENSKQFFPLMIFQYLLVSIYPKWDEILSVEPLLYSFI